MSRELHSAVSVSGPPPELLYRWWGVYQDAYWRFGALYSFFPTSRVTSFFRTVEENRAAGGSPVSQHLLGLAVDFVVPFEQRGDFEGIARLLHLVPVNEGSHVHVQRYPAGTIPPSVFQTVIS